jgi:hypothetical protein
MAEAWAGSTAVAVASTVVEEASMAAVVVASTVVEAGTAAADTANLSP